MTCSLMKISDFSKKFREIKKKFANTLSTIWRKNSWMKDLKTISRNSSRCPNWSLNANKIDLFLFYGMLLFCNQKRFVFGNIKMQIYERLIGVISIELFLQMQNKDTYLECKAIYHWIFVKSLLCYDYVQCCQFCFFSKIKQKCRSKSFFWNHIKTVFAAMWQDWWHKTSH